MSFAALPIGISQQDVTNFGTMYGQIVALKNSASEYPQTYSAWQDLLRRGESIRQSIANLAGVNAVYSQIGQTFTGLLTGFIPASILPDSVLSNNIYGIDPWKADAAALINQLRQISALKNSGLTTTEISTTIQPTGLLNTVSSGIKAAVGGVENIVFGAVIVGGIYLYLTNRNRR